MGKNIDYKISAIEKDEIGNFISLLLTTSEFSIKLINIYAPNRDSPHFFESIKIAIENSTHDYCIICGDFNLTLDPEMDLYNYRNITSRLDYFLTSNTLLYLVTKCQIKAGYRSDHSISELVINICKFQRGRGLWKFNCSLLKNKDYLIKINSLIEREKLNYALPV